MNPHLRLYLVGCLWLFKEMIKPVWLVSQKIFCFTRGKLTPVDDDRFPFTRQFKATSYIGLSILLLIQLSVNLPLVTLTDVELLIADGLGKMFSTSLYVGGALILGAMVMLAASRKGYRRASARFLLIPLKKLGACIAVLISIPLAGKVLPMAALLLPDVGNVEVPVLLVMIGLFVAGYGIMIAVAAFLSFLAAVVIAAPRDLFAAQDGHPHLRPLVTLILGVLSIILAIVKWNEDGSTGNYQLIVFLILVLAGPLGNMVASVVEMRWLQRAGVSFRLPKTGPVN